MSDKTYKQVTGVLLAVAAVVHTLRLLMGWEVVFNGWTVPMWVSVMALVIAAYLAYQGLKK